MIMAADDSDDTWLRCASLLETPRDWTETRYRAMQEDSGAKGRSRRR